MGQGLVSRRPVGRYFQPYQWTFSTNQLKRLVPIKWDTLSFCTFQNWILPSFRHTRTCHFRTPIALLRYKATSSFFKAPIFSSSRTKAFYSKLWLDISEASSAHKVPPFNLFQVFISAKLSGLSSSPTFFAYCPFLPSSSSMMIDDQS